MDMFQVFIEWLIPLIQSLAEGSLSISWISIYEIQLKI